MNSETCFVFKILLNLRRNLEIVASYRDHKYIASVRLCIGCEKFSLRSSAAGLYLVLALGSEQERDVFWQPDEQKCETGTLNVDRRYKD